MTKAKLAFETFEQALANKRKWATEWQRIELEKREKVWRDAYQKVKGTRAEPRPAYAPNPEWQKVWAAITPSPTRKEAWALIQKYEREQARSLKDKHTTYMNKKQTSAADRAKAKAEARARAKAIWGGKW